MNLPKFQNNSPLAAMCSGSDEWCKWTVVSVDSTTSGESDGVQFSDIDFTMRQDKPPDETCKWFRQRFVINDAGSWAATTPQVSPETCEVP